MALFSKTRTACLVLVLAAAAPCVAVDTSKITGHAMDRVSEEGAEGTEMTAKAVAASVAHTESRATAFSPDRVESALATLAEEGPDGPGCACAQGDQAAHADDQVSLLSASTTAAECPCSAIKSEGAVYGQSGREAAEDAAEVEGERVYLTECPVAQSDLDFWRLKQRGYQAGGIMLENTFAYASSCAQCSSHNLKCKGDKDVQDLAVLGQGYCLCMWRVDSQDPQTELLPCDRCMPDCIGKEHSFNEGKFLQPTFKQGVCLKKGGYLRVE